MEVKKTPLHDNHLRHRARMIDFFGWHLPVEYSGILKEVREARTGVALFDASHMGELRVRGPKSLDFLQYLASNDVTRIQPWQLQYNLFVNPQGGIIDDFMLYRFPDSFVCVVNASNKDADFNWLQKHAFDGVEIVDESTDTALLSLQGPCAERVLARIISRPLDALSYMRVIEAVIQDHSCIISRSGYTGEDGFEIYCPAGIASFLWNELCRYGADFSLQPAGLGARDVLRIEAGYPLYGNEINLATNPVEAGLAWAVKHEAKEFIAGSAMRSIIKNGLSRRRIGFIMTEKGVPRHGYDICGSKGEVIGTVTSGTYSPHRDAFIGMGYVASTFASIGNPIGIKIRGSIHQAQICAFPFVALGCKSGVK